MISHQRSGDSLGQGEMYPVRAAAEIVKRLHSYNFPWEDIQDLPINYVEIDGMGYKIPSSLILLRLRQAVSSIGHEVLGFTAEEISTHSNHSGGAMGMFLSGAPVCTIMLMVRWSSDAFMRYIQNKYYLSAMAFQLRCLLTSTSIRSPILSIIRLMEISGDGIIQI
jgi:hypothetical protein